MAGQVNVIPLLVVSILGLVFTTMLHAGEVLEEPNQQQDCGFSIDPGAEKNVYHCAGGLFTFVLDVFTFNIDGAPWWVRVPVAAIFIVPWVLLLIEVVWG